VTLPHPSPRLSSLLASSLSPSFAMPAARRQKRTPARIAASPLFSSPSSSPGGSAAARAARADLEVDETTRAINAHQRATRPKETRRKYDRMQQEYKVWCRERGFEEATWCVDAPVQRSRSHADDLFRSETVTGPKLSTFLYDCVIHRAPRKRGPKPKEGSKPRKRSKPAPVETTAPRADADAPAQGEAAGVPEGPAGARSPLSMRPETSV